MGAKGQAELERELEAELARDRSLRSIFHLGSWIVSLSTLAVLLLLIMAMGRTSPWLLALSIHAAFTRISYYVATKVFLYPRFLLRLDSAVDAEREAARAVLGRERTAVVRPILVNLLRRADDEAVAAMPADELASLARAHDVGWHRRLGAAWMAGWTILTIVMWTIVIATGGGPTS